MNEDEIEKALEEAEDEVARIEAEIMGPPPPPFEISEFSAAIARPLSLASLSLQCKSLALIDVTVNSLNARNLPAIWAQNEARSMIAPPPTSIPFIPIQSDSGAQHRALSAAAATATARKVSNSWKRCLFEAAGIRTPLAAMWHDALCAGRVSDDSSRMVPVSSVMLQFLPLIDPQLADYASHNFVVNLSLGQLQVRCMICTTKFIPQSYYFCCRCFPQRRFLL